MIWSEWSLVNTKWAIFQLYSFWLDDDDDAVCFLLDQHAELKFLVLAHSTLKQQSTDIHIALLGHIILTQPTSLCSYSIQLHMVSGAARNFFTYFDCTFMKYQLELLKFYKFFVFTYMTYVVITIFFKSWCKDICLSSY
jgi:hypothetical protein